RTQKLSSLAPMVLGGKLPGRVGRSRVIFFCFAKLINISHGIIKRKVKKSVIALFFTFFYYYLNMRKLDSKYTIFE
ncbi:MAG: hypothetical protein RR835_11935, partial [Peptostreptococcaceae bacterium]